MFKQNAVHNNISVTNIYHFNNNEGNISSLKEKQGVFTNKKPYGEFYIQQMQERIKKEDEKEMKLKKRAADRGEAAIDQELPSSYWKPEMQ